MKTHSIALPLLLCLCVSACTSVARDPAGPAEWQTLFDGSTLNGWVTRGGHYDGDARWTIEDGALTGRQGPGREGGLIYTEGLYANFEFECDVKIDYPFDSGIFLRMVPEEKGAQVTIDYRPGGQIGAIYSDGYLQHNEQGAELFKKDEWNHFRVVCSGSELAIDVWLNGEQLTQYRMAPGNIGYAPTGRIGLQVHGGENVPLETKVQFKDIRVRTMPVPLESPWTTDAKGFMTTTQRGLIEGWRPLFDGQDLEGWELVGPPEGVMAKDGVVTVSSGDGYLKTKADYRDFELRLDFKVGPVANSGVFLRAERSEKNPAYSGCEIQILDDVNWEKATNSKLADYQFTGGLYGSVPAGHPGLLKLSPEWNTYHITYQGTRLVVKLNGVELYDVDTLTVPGDPPFAQRAPTGFIGLQRHSGAKETDASYVAFRNVFVKSLEPGP